MSRDEDPDEVTRMTNGESKYPHVFRPIALGPVEVSNRIYIPPHGIPVEAPTPGHEAHMVPSAEIPHYFAERAAGGVGLIFHSTQTGPAARHQYVKHTPWFPESVPSYAAVADAVHEHGAKIMAEIWHASFMSGLWDVLGPKTPQLGPSPMAFYAEPSVLYELSKTDIRRLVGDHAQTARHLREAGYDGIEVHASHGATTAMFLSPSFNHRSDEYGGCLENRVRLLSECLETVRVEIGSEMALGIRINADELLHNGYGTDEAAEMIVMLRDRELLDFVDLDVSVEPDQAHLMTTPFFEVPLHNAQRVVEVARQITPLPVLAAPGRLTSIAQAEKLIAAGGIDMVGAVRGHIAEPNLVRYARDGREEDGRTCIAANHCIEAGATGGFGCAINPEAGKEIRWGRPTHAPTSRTMRVVVVGGGPAGAEAARVAAARGHDVTLLEQRKALGGGLALWARLPGREQVGKQVGWWTRQLDALGVDVRTATVASEQTVLSLEPEVVVLATGSRYARNGDNGMTREAIPGWDQEFVMAVDTPLLDGSWPQGKVIVLDDEGMHAAAGVAEAAARHGADVEIVTRKPMPADALAYQMMLPYVLPRLAEAGVRISPFTFIKQIDDRQVTLLDLIGGHERVVEDVNHVVMGTMRKPVTTLRTLEGQVPYVYVVGDGLAPRTLREASYEGYRFGRRIGDDDMPKRVIDEVFDERQALRPAELADRLV
jgi:2,4-dienoyl-CoA reductase-like NADH-dependent reductase (Old Yellow Enzyme family)/thioredoxin reductase